MEDMLDKESVDRFAVYAAFAREMADIEYQMFFDHAARNGAQRLPPPSPAMAKPSVAGTGDDGSSRAAQKQDAHHVRRYCSAFYQSFAQSEARSRASQVEAVWSAESALRRSIMGHERGEWAALCRGFARVLGVRQPLLLFVTALEAEEAEQVARRLLSWEYYEMLLEACTTEETLRRRHMTLSEEPQARGRVESAEVPDWIEARRLQMDRERNTENQEAEEERWRRIAYFRWRQQQLYQMFLLEQNESYARQTLERRERLEAGAVAGQYNNSFKGARYAQLRYEETQRALDADGSRAIAARESTARSEILREQFDCFRCLGALEVQSYLAATRRQMENQSMQ